MAGQVDEIDPLLRDLIADLNAAGYETFCSCQGKTTEQDYENERHCDQAFVTFSVAVLRTLRSRARKLGLSISYRNRFITALNGDEKDHEAIFAKNLRFPAKMRELFGLTDVNGEVELRTAPPPIEPLSPP